MSRPDPVFMITAQVIAIGAVGTVFQILFPVHTALQLIGRIENLLVGFAIGYILTKLTRGDY